MSENEVMECPLCSTTLNEYSRSVAVLFVCPNSGFELLTTKELFPRCLRQK